MLSQIFKFYMEKAGSLFSKFGVVQLIAYIFIAYMIQFKEYVVGFVRGSFNSNILSLFVFLVPIIFFAINAVISIHIIGTFSRIINRAFPIFIASILFFMGYVLLLIDSVYYMILTFVNADLNGVYLFVSELESFILLTMIINTSPSLSRLLLNTGFLLLSLEVFIFSHEYKTKTDLLISGVVILVGALWMPILIFVILIIIGDEFKKIRI